MLEIESETDSSGYVYLTPNQGGVAAPQVCLINTGYCESLYDVI